jgi:hypothetical protein
VPIASQQIDGRVQAEKWSAWHSLHQRLELLYQDSEKIAVNSAAIGRILAT